MYVIILGKTKDVITFSVNFSSNQTKSNDSKIFITMKTMLYTRYNVYKYNF